MSHRIFGIPIDDVLGRLDAGSLPTVLRNIFTYLNASEHIGTEGLFRVSAGVKELENLKTGLDAGDTPDLKRYDSHLVAGLLKAYFIELPEPLFTFALYDSFIAAADHVDTRGQLRSLIQKLPPNNRLLASCLFLFLSRVCAESERNKMNGNNLAIVFGQILLRPKVESLELLRHAPKITNILRTMIEDYYELFPRTKEDEKLIAKGELSSLEALIGVPSKKKKKKKKTERDEEDLTPEQLKLRNIKQTVDEAISGVLDRLEEMVAELNSAASLEETIEIAKRVRSAKYILFSVPDGAEQAQQANSTL